MRVVPDGKETVVEIPLDVMIHGKRAYIDADAFVRELRSLATAIPLTRPVGEVGREVADKFRLSLHEMATGIERAVEVARNIRDA